VNTTVITEVLLQNSVDLRSGERGCHSGMCATSSEVGIVPVGLEGVTGVTEGEDCEAMTSPLTHPRVGFMLLSV
jgi:hypothetical protein